MRYVINTVEELIRNRCYRRIKKERPLCENISHTLCPRPCGFNYIFIVAENNETPVLTAHKHVFGHCEGC